MYRNYYGVFNKQWKNNEIIMTDTDSLILSITTEPNGDIYKDMEKIKEHLDTSDYSTDHTLYSKNNAKVIGKFKDELNGKIMQEIIYMKSKCYSYIVNDEEKKKTKLFELNQRCKKVLAKSTKRVDLSHVPE